MATLTKTSSGEIYINDFSTMSTLWEISPNVPYRFILVEDGLMMTHGDVNIMYLMKLPDESCVFQAKITYEPTLIIDTGGLIIMSDVNNCVECTVYYNSLSEVDQYYQYIKVIKNGSTFSFDISKDGIVWTHLGSSKIVDAHDIGFFLNGVENVNCSNLILNEVVLCKSNYITFRNIANGMKVKLSDSSGNIINFIDNDSESTNLTMDISTCSFPITNATINIYDDSNMEILNEVFDVVGGDEFEYNVLLEVYLDTKLIDPVNFINIGGLSHTGKECILEIKNTDTLAITGKTLTIEEYSPFFRGYTFVTVSLDQEIPDYKQSINLPNILPNSSCLILLKIDRDLSNAGPFFTQGYRFKIVIG